MNAQPLELSCPRCREAMQEVEGAGGVRVDHCPGCGGAWYDEGELAEAFHLTGHVDPLAQGTNKVRSEPCPRCQRGLVELTWPAGTGHRVDACPSCRGVFLDAGEAASIRRALAAQGRVGAAPPPEVPSPGPEAPHLPELPGGATHRRALLALVLLLLSQGAAVGLLQAVRLFAILGDAERVSGDGALAVGAQALALPVGAWLFGRLSPGHAPLELVMGAVPAILIFVALTPAPFDALTVLGLLVLGVPLAVAAARIGDPSPREFRLGA
ncbi:MAG: zf-TFIIB domain-containing protein [Alphaproteobacteria bacterium]|nr:zf-TFIIB domain-containing protein [Alphaproteobacteria bacterium]